MNGWGEQRGHCSPCGRVLRTGLELESNKWRSRCHHVQMGYRVSGGINGAQRAARPGFCQSVGHGKFGFQGRGHEYRLICGGIVTDAERKPPAVRDSEEDRNTSASRLCRAGAQVGPGAPLAPLKSSNLPSHPMKQVILFAPFTDEETEAESC